MYLKKIGILHRNCDVVHIRRQHEPVIRVWEEVGKAVVNLQTIFSLILCQVYHNTSPK